MKSLLIFLLVSVIYSFLVDGAAIVLEKQPRPTQVRLDGECNSYDREKLNEGYHTCVYKDSFGHPSVGVGFNLDKESARAEIAKVGADYDKVLAGSQCLNDSQIRQLFDMDMAVAVACAQGFVSGIGSTAESAVADMAFILGCDGMDGFVIFRSLLEKHDYAGAAKDMQGTIWCKQVGSRCERDAACIKAGVHHVGAAIVQEKQLKPIQVRLDGECNSYDREKLNEGYRTCVYKDSMGIPTIGVGFNLKKFSAKAEIESVGADYDKVLAGSQCLTDSQIHRLFDMDMAVAVTCAERFASGIGSTAESAVADMAFNLGCAGLEAFTTFRSLLEKHDYAGAAEDMQHTAWCGQVGYRCGRDVACIKAGVN